MLLQILQYIAAIVTILTGLVSLFWPLRVLGFTGLDVNGGRGVTEIRTILGAASAKQNKRTVLEIVE